MWLDRTLTLGHHVKIEGRNLWQGAALWVEHYGWTMQDIAGERHVYKSRKAWENWTLDPTVTDETTRPTYQGSPCARCGGTKRYATHGRECVRCRKQWRKENRSKYEKPYSAKQRRNPLLKSHGLTRERYQELWEAQQGLCAICGKPETDSLGRSLAIDHCHTTGNFRGLLCGSCNRGLGFFFDSPENLERAANYIRNNPWDL